MRQTAITASLLAAALLWLTGLGAAQEKLTRTSAEGPVSVSVTLIPPVEPGKALRAEVVLNTHSVSLDDIAFDAVVALREPGGVTPAAVEQAQGSGHHRRAVVVFPALLPGDRIEIIVRNVGGVAERVFRWELPLR